MKLQAQQSVVSGSCVVSVISGSCLKNAIKINMELCGNTGGGADSSATGSELDPGQFSC